MSIRFSIFSHQRFFSGILLALSCLCNKTLSAIIPERQFWDVNQLIGVVADYTYSQYYASGNVNILEQVQMNEALTDGIMLDDKVFGAKSLHDKMGWTQGCRVGLECNLGEKIALEILYNYYSPWKAKKKFEMPGLTYPFTGYILSSIDYFNADKAEFTYEVFLQGGEFNLYRFLTPRHVNYFSFAVGGGMHILDLREHLNLEFSRNFYGKWNVSDYQTSVSNFLWGPQLIFDFEMNFVPRFSLAFQAKCGGFCNFGDVDSIAKDENNTDTLFQFDKSKAIASLYLEASALLSYHAFHCLDIHIGYQGSFIDPLFRAHYQLVQDTFFKEKISHKNSLLVVDGLRVGIQVGF